MTRNSFLIVVKKSEYLFFANLLVDRMNVPITANKEWSLRMEINWKKNTIFFMPDTLSLFGTLLVQYAILWHITLKTQSGTMMTVFTIAGFLPMFFISPFAGVWADRFNRKHIINIADGSIALVSLIVVVFLLFGFDDYIGILLICAVTGISIALLCIPFIASKTLREAGRSHS